MFLKIRVRMQKYDLIFLLFLFRNDKILKKSQWMKYTVQELRKIISETMLEEANQKFLGPVLYYGYDHFLTPEDWVELMNVEDEHYLYCDLPFVQLTSNLLKKKMHLK